MPPRRTAAGRYRRNSRSTRPVHAVELVEPSAPRSRRGIASSNGPGALLEVEEIAEVERVAIPVGELRRPQLSSMNRSTLENSPSCESM